MTLSDEREVPGSLSLSGAYEIRSGNRYGAVEDSLRGNFRFVQIEQRRASVGRERCSGGSQGHRLRGCRSERAEASSASAISSSSPGASTPTRWRRFSWCCGDDVVGSPHCRIGWLLTARRQVDLVILLAGSAEHPRGAELQRADRPQPIVELRERRIERRGTLAAPC